MIRQNIAARLDAASDGLVTGGLRPHVERAEARPSLSNIHTPSWRSLRLTRPVAVARTRWARVSPTAKPS